MKKLILVFIISVLLNTFISLMALGVIVKLGWLAFIPFVFWLILQGYLTQKFADGENK